MNAFSLLPTQTYIPGSVVPQPAPSNGWRTLSWWLLVAGVVLRLALSAPALHRLGVPYDLPWGPFPSKIHPGSYVLMLAFVTGLVSHGNPVASLLELARKHRLLAGYMLSMVAVFAWTVLRHGPSGQAFFIDTLWMPGVAALTIVMHHRGRQRQLLTILMLLLLANAALAVGEAAIGRRLIPLHAGRDGIIEEYWFRASALMGHPLANSLVTVSLMPVIVVMPWSLHLRLAALGLLTLSLLSFGSRANLAAVGVYALLACVPLVLHLVRGRFSYRQISGGLVGLALAAAALAAVVATTRLGDRIFKNLTWDNSADVRLLAFDVLRYVRGTDLWFGIPVERIEGIAGRVGIDLRYEAIENFWVNLLVLLGLVGFALFLFGLACLVLHLWRGARTPLKVAIVMYFIVASGANTLAAKTASLTLLAVALQCASALHRPGSASAHPNARPLPAWRLAGASR
jgi:hypothetical protein